MKKAKLLALLIVVVMVLTGVLAACQKTHTVTYFNGDKKIGEEKVADGKTASGKVNGWTLVGGLTDKDGNAFALTTPITSDIELHGVWTDDNKAAGSVNNDFKVGGQVILGSTTELSGDFRWVAIDGGNPGASDLDVNKLTNGYSTMEPNQTGTYVQNQTVIKEFTTEELGSEGEKTYKMTFEINSGLKMSGGTEIKAANFLAYVLAMSTPISKQAFDTNRAGYAFVGWDTFSKYDGTNASESATKEFSGVRLLGDYKFSLEVNSDNYPYYYVETLGAVSPYDLKLVLGNGVEVKDDGQGAYLSDAWYAKDTTDTTKYAKAKHLEDARFTVDTYEYTGPYSIQSWNSSSKEAILKINPNFAGNFEGQKPHIETIICRHAVSETQFAQLENGQLDVLGGLTGGTDVTAALGLVNKGSFKEVHYDRAGYGKVQFECDFGPTMFAEVRQALAYCLDREDFANTFCGGYGAVVHGPYSVNFDSYVDLEDQLEANLNSYAVSTAKAKQVLEAGGWVYNADGSAYSGTGVRYKKLAADEMGPDNVNQTYASVENTDGQEYKTVKIGDDYYMPLVINWFGTENNEVTELLTTKLLNGTNATECGMVIRQTIGNFTQLLGNIYRIASYGYSGTPTYGMFNLATGWNVAVYDYSYNWIDKSSEMYDDWLSNSANKLSDEYDAAFRWEDHQGLTFDQAWEQSQHKLGMNYLSMAMVYSVDIGDTEEYNKWFYQYLIRWNELIPDLPLYGNIYYDCYNSKILNFKATPFFGAADALLYCAVADAQ